MHLARLVGAVLTPHDGVHRELGVGGSTTEDVPDALVFLVLQPELGERLLDVGCAFRVLNRVLHRHAATKLLSTETNIARPSVPGPVNGSIACSGCGIRPT